MPHTSTVEAQHDRRHDLTGDEYARESIVYFAHLPELGMTFGAYTWVNGAGKAGASSSLMRRGAETLRGGVDGIQMDEAADFDDWSVGPLTLRQSEPHRSASVRWDGEDFSFELEYTASHEPFAYGDAPGGCPVYVADDRIEQAGLMRGTLRVGGEEHHFDVQGHRDHSWGNRDWKMMQHYKWFEAQAGESQVHVFEINARGTRTVYGYVNRDGVLAALTHAEFDVTFDDELFVTQVEIALHDEEGRHTVVRGTEQARMELPVSPDATLVDTAMDVDIDGTPGGGYIDLSWPPAYLQHMRETRYQTGASPRSA